MVWKLLFLSTFNCNEKTSKMGIPNHEIRTQDSTFMAPYEVGKHKQAKGELGDLPTL